MLVSQCFLAFSFNLLATFVAYIYVVDNFVILFYTLKEELLRGRPGYEHLNDALHILIEAELPANIVDVRLRQAQEIIEELLKLVVSHPTSVELI
jgi:hypothetical protein